MSFDDLAAVAQALIDEGVSTWELTPTSTGTVVAYGVYCRGAMLPPGQSERALLATAQKVMDEGLQRLKSMVEG